MSSIHNRSRQLFTIADLIEWKPPPITRIIAGGLLNARGKMIIFGGEGTWKSMLAQHLAHCLARGSNFLQFKTTKCNVYKLQVELPDYEDRDRLLQYAEGSKRIYISKYPADNPTPAQLDTIESKATDYAYPDNLVLRTEQFIHIGKPSGFEELRKDIALCKTEMNNYPLVVILDPIYKMFGGDLSDTRDMNYLIDNMDIAMSSNPREGLDFTLIIIAHSRKEQIDSSGRPVALGSQDIAGSRHLMNWTDTILRIDAGEGDETSTRYNLTFTKHRTARVTIPFYTIKWDADTLHPEIIWKRFPTDTKLEDISPIRGDADLSRLE